jgi:hypothetical protein
MGDNPDFEIGGRFRARRLRASSPPRAITLGEHVRIEQTERRRPEDHQVQPDETYRALEIEKHLRGEIMSD